mmetsp:Transcript_16872/g.47572  ORF Transcript_16872/g.47572 Transcript_16872/m.47572 type:complete len:228 (+) Transcript_16872:63-746(+)
MREGRDFGSKTGGGAPASKEWANVDRRERLRQLALETIDLAKDPYFMRNHIGSYECKLCLTLHNNEGNYLAHTQGKRHQNNLKRRAARDAKNAEMSSNRAVHTKPRVAPRRTQKIGRPGYRVTKQVHSETGQKSLFFEIDYARIEEGLQPRTRIMSSWEQSVEPKNPNFQYLLVAAEPYETIAFKIPNAPLEKVGGMVPSWDRERLQFRVTLVFQNTPPTPAAAPYV